jgi:pyruvate-ferredoxin/flavodoxin oxidoreductase
MRYNPSLRAEGKNPFQLDSRAPSIPLKDYSYNEARYTMLARSHPDVAAKLLEEAQEDVNREWRVYSARAANPGHPDAKSLLAAEPQKAPLANPEVSAD